MDMTAVGQAGWEPVDGGHYGYDALHPVEARRVAAVEGS